MAYTNPFWAASETDVPEKDYTGTGSDAIDKATGFNTGILGGFGKIADKAKVKTFDFKSNSVNYTAIIFAVVLIAAFFVLLRTTTNK